MMRCWLAAAVWMLLVVLPVDTYAQRAVTTPWLARVTWVSDGDSLWVRSEKSGQRVRLRLQGIDAPELCQVSGTQARQALLAKVSGQRVRVSVQARDTYGRAVARVVRVRDGADVARAMVREGWAWADRFRKQPVQYEREEARARAAKRGLFARSRPERPVDFRRRHGPCR
ncbi:MAG: thermonuclease family protein [Burkholderiaceae bacterium]|jgi:endonuclease YncB( thermonuclease family)|nr:thermonuclease family protein [Burkholderiaceae bacterium]